MKRNRFFKIPFIRTILFTGANYYCLRLFYLLAFLTLALYSPVTFGQNTRPDSLLRAVQVAPADSFLMKLPPLEILIDSAIARAPLLKGHQLSIKKNELDVKRLKNNWRKDIVTGGVNVNYGLFDNLIISKDLGIDNLNTKANQQTRYTLGVAVKIPITAFLDKYDFRMAQLTLEQTEIEKQVLIQSIREEVYNRYNFLINSYQKYNLLLEDIDGYEILLSNAEKDFLSNRITVEEVTNVKMSVSKAKMELNDARNEFFRARWFLEELTGVPIR